MTKQTRRYALETGWIVLLKDMNISPQDILRHADLPLDLFNRKSPTVTATESLRLWEGLAYVMRDIPNFPLLFGKSITVETFSPPIFACFCSDNLIVAAKRLSYYKPLIAPMKLDIIQDSQQTTLTINALEDANELPATLIAMEFVWWVQLIRLATREHIIPKAVYTKHEIPNKQAYEDFFGISISQASFNGLAFSPEDSNRPFLTHNEQMWEIFEPSLTKKMQDLEIEASFVERVRACLMEILASGQYSIRDVATKLAVSPRTLQRRLHQENTTFQKELDSLREELARNYLLKSDYSSGQIAFLLGYEEANSFFRAFRAWTGQTPELVRANSRAN
ncbi:MAG: AraC family transcriptional regulator [Phototrophicaceae bacterium]